MIHRYTQFLFTGIISPSHFANDFSRKRFLMLYSMNWQNFIVWLSLILEILGNMSVEIFWEQKEFLRWNKSISIIFEGFSLTKTCLRPESAPLMLHSWQRGPNPSYFLNTPPILPTPFFQILYNPTLSCCLQPCPNCFFPTQTALLIPLRGQ